MDSVVLAGILRHLITIGGGFLVRKGYMDDGAIEVIAGAVASLAGIAWSVFAKIQNKKETAAMKKELSG